jgi:hypothetical protein
LPADAGGQDGEEALGTLGVLGVMDRAGDAGWHRSPRVQSQRGARAGSPGGSGAHGLAGHIKGGVLVARHGHDRAWAGREFVDINRARAHGSQEALELGGSDRRLVVRTWRALQGGPDPSIVDA